MQNQNTKPNAELLWKQLDDVLAPHLHLSVVDRAVYFHLVRHSRLEGNRTVRFSILKVARNLYLSHGPVRESVRRLVEMGVLRLIERTKTGHLVEPRLPEEIRSLRGAATASRFPVGRFGRPSNLEKLNFMKTRPLRQSIHNREGGKCFYCLRRIPVRMKCLDHVIPRVEFGPIPIATWSPAVWNATPQRKSIPPQTISARSTAMAASPPPNSTNASAP